MDYFRNYFSNPQQFANWQKYAGMPTDGSSFQGSVAPSSAPVGVPPPSSVGEAVQQKMTQIGSQFSNLTQNMSGAASQMGQGNFMNAANAFSQGVKAPTSPQAPTIAPVIDEYDYTRRIGE